MRAAFFDIDGTLYSHTQHGVPDSTYDALMELHRQGDLLFVATGRNHFELAGVDLRQLPFDGYITMNGQYCFDRNFHELYSAPVPEDALEVLLDKFQQKELSVMLTQRTQTVINRIPDQLREQYAASSLPLPAIGTIRFDEPVYQAVLHGAKETIADCLRQMPLMQSFYWNDWACDVIPQGAGKEVALVKICEAYGILIEDTVAFGDADNDAAMLKQAGIGFAMGNATETLKQSCDRITADIDHDGIALALHQIGWLK